MASFVILFVCLFAFVLFNSIFTTDAFFASIWFSIPSVLINITSKWFNTPPEWMMKKYSISFPLNTHDHGKITVLGLSQNLWVFAQDHPGYLKPGSKNALSETSGEDILDLFTFDKEMSDAIDTIKSSNSGVDFQLQNVSAAHFDAEQFVAGYERLSRLKSQLITSLLQEKKYEHARQLAGEFLHTLQDFYSHSNWIELGYVVPFESIDQGGVMVRYGGVVPLAGIQERTCRNCTPFGDWGYFKDDCHNNLITNKVTSGYYGGQDVSKPLGNGKCSHGGFPDTTKKHDATGGINKDSTSRIFSPHHRLHEIASDVAIQATKQFFDDIQTAVGDRTYATFLNMVRTMALVIDVSGSMSDEIEEVKKVSINFVKEVTNEQNNSPFLFVLVPFEDPGVGPVTKTSDPQEVIRAVNNLRASGGGDCPELALTALRLGILNCLPGSVIYFFSDAGPKDRHLLPEVYSLAKKKRIIINFILTGACFRRLRRSSRRSDVKAALHLDRTKRSLLTDADFFDQLASQTGGQVLETTKRDIAVVSEIIQLSTSNSSLLDVTILNFRDSSAKQITNRVHYMQTDKTLSKIVIKFTATSSLAAKVQRSEDLQLVGTKTLHSSSKMRILELTGLPIGQLQITISCFGPYSLDVSAKSPLDFTYQLLSVDNNETGAINSIQGNPTKGRPLLLSMETKGNINISSLDSVTLLNEEGLAMETFPVTRGEGLYGNSFYSTLTPSNSFRIQVIGRDKDRNTFVRVKPIFYTLEEVELRTGSEVNSSTFTLHPGELHRVPVKLENIGREKTLYITSSDDKGYVQYTKPSNVTVNGNSFAMTDVYLKAPVNATYGETTTVTVFVSERPDQNIPMNFLVFYLTVASKKLDVVPPSCEVLRISGSCNRVHNTPNCINSNWTAEVRISDHGQGIVSVAARSLGNSSFRAEPFIKGQENNSVNALYTSSCCYTRVTIIGLDKVGNMGKCHISVVQDIVNLKGKLTGNVTEIVLIPGETTEIPFMVTNLGTRGLYSFSAHVMQSESMFSYVRPLGFVIEANRSRECQLITMAQREDICKLRTVTVSATLQSGNLNNRTGTSKNLTLFSINTWTVMNAPAGSVGSKALSVCVEEKEVNISCGGSIRVNFSVTSFVPTKTAFEMKVVRELYVTSTFYPQSIHLGYKETAMVSMLLSAKKTSTVPRLVFVAVKASAAEVDENETILFNISVKLNPCTVKAPSTPSNWTTAMKIGIPVAAGFILLVALFAFCYCKYYKRKSKHVQSESKLEMAVGNLHDRGWSIYSSGIDNLNLQGKLN